MQVELGVEDDDFGDLELQDLNRHSLRAQLLASCLLQSIGPKKVEDALNDAWQAKQPLDWCTRHVFRDAVRFECEHLLASTALQGFLRRKWRGRLIDQLITQRVYSSKTGVFMHMQTRKWLTVSTCTTSNLGLVCDSSLVSRRSANFDPVRGQVIAMSFFIFLPLNLVCLPFVALYPPFEKVTISISRRGLLVDTCSTTDTLSLP